MPYGRKKPWQGEQTGKLEREIRREFRELKAKHEQEDMALEREYARPANDNSLQKSFEKADLQQDESREPSRGMGRERTIPPPGHGRG